MQNIVLYRDDRYFFKSLYMLMTLAFLVYESKSLAFLSFSCKFGRRKVYNVTFDHVIPNSYAFRQISRLNEPYWLY